MKRKQRIILMMLLLLVVMSAVACKKKNDYSDDYAIKDVKLCETNTNSADYMKGFSMQGTIGDLIDNQDISSVAMCYTTEDINGVKSFFKAAPFDKPDGFLAEIDALDRDGKIRNLVEDKKSYLDGAVDNPIRFYSDAVDLIHGGSLLQNAGTYHFYLVVIGNERALWVGEADKTFTIEQKTIDTANEFKKAFDVIEETTLLPDQDAASLSQEEKTDAAQKYYAGLVDALNLGMSTEVKYGDDPSYPDDYEVTLTKGDDSSMTYATVHFGKADASADTTDKK